MRFTYVVLALGILSVASAAPAAAGPAEQMLPEDTLFILSVSNSTESLGRLKAHPLYALYMEPDFQKFIEKPLNQFKEMTATAAVTPGEFLELIQGQMALAVTGLREVSKGTQYVGAVIILDVGSNEAKFREKVKIAEPEAFETETHRRVEEDFRGVTIVTYLPREGDPKAEDQGVTSGPDCWFLSNGIFALASDPEVLKGLLVRRGDPEAKGLASSESYKAVVARMGGTGDLFAYVDAANLWTLIEKAMPAAGGGGLVDPSMAMAIMQQIGLREPKALAVSAELTDAGMDQKFYLLSPKPRTGIMKLFDGENSALMPPRFVPPDVSSAATMALDMQGLWKETRRIMDEIQPGLTETMDEQLAMLKEQMGIDIQADLIGSLGKSLTVYQFEPKPADPDAPFPMPQQRVVIALEVTNGAKIQQVLDIAMQMLAGLTGMPAAGEEYMGVKITALDMGMQKAAMAVAADHLIISLQMDDLKDLIRSLGKEDVKCLVDSEDFRTAMEGLARMRSMVSWADPRRSVDTMAAQIQTIGMFVPDINEWLDVSLFPAETMKKYLDVGGGVMVNEEDGVFILSRSRMKRPTATPKTPEAPEVPEVPEKESD